MNTGAGAADSEHETPTEDKESHLPLRAKALPRRELSSDLVPTRMVNEVLYCERLFYLEWVQKEFADNVFTVDGRAVHKRADRPGGRLPEPANGPDAKAPARSTRTTTTSLSAPTSPGAFGSRPSAWG